LAEETVSRILASLKGFVRKLRTARPERIWRLERQRQSGEDFGLGAPIDGGQAKGRRSWVVPLVLSYSRKGYSEAVTRQDTETFLHGLENGLRSFGGSPLSRPNLPEQAQAKKSQEVPGGQSLLIPSVTH
jgi:hypothetical protein